MTSTARLALMQSMTLPADSVAEWVHLLPAGAITTIDGRGPYQVPDAAAMIAESLHQGAKLPIDENHAIDLAAPRGEASPARGYIVELQAREDGIWGRVEWTESGKALMADRAYLGLSPAILHDTKGKVLRILRASLVNRPNLRGLTALHQEDPMSLLQRLATLLGLESTTTEDALIERITSLHQEAPQAVALQSQMAEIGVALGVPENATSAAILTAARGKARNDEHTVVVALQSELATVTTQLNTLREGAARDRAEAFVDGEIKRGRVGVKPLRDHYIAMHMADAGRVEKELGALPVLGASGTLSAPPAKVAEGEIALNAEQSTAARLLNVDPKTYAATLKAERTNEEAL